MNRWSKLKEWYNNQAYFTQIAILLFTVYTTFHIFRIIGILIWQR